MAYGHAERTLAAIRLLEAETAELLGRLPHLDCGQSRWLQEVTGGGTASCPGRPALCAGEDGPGAARCCAAARPR